MFDYFINYSNNAHQVCCEGSPTKGLYARCQCGDHRPYSRSQVRLKLDYFFNLQYLRHCLSYYIQTWHDGKLMDDLYAHAGFDDLGLDARVTVGRQRQTKISFECCRQLSKAISMTRTCYNGRTLFCYVILIFANVYIVVQLVFYFSLLRPKLEKALCWNSRW